MTRLDHSEPIADFEFTVTSEQFDRFFEAVGWQLPHRPVMPPTLDTMFRSGEFQALQKLKISLETVLHGEQKYRFFKSIEPNQPYRGATFLNSRYEKSGGGGTMAFYVFQTNLVDASDTVCVECLSTIIVRG